MACEGLTCSLDGLALQLNGVCSTASQAPPYDFVGSTLRLNSSGLSMKALLRFRELWGGVQADGYPIKARNIPRSP